MASSFSSSVDQHQTVEKNLFGKSQGQWLACLGPCMLTFGFPFLIPGISLTCVGFIEKANVPTFGSVHTLGLFCLFTALILIVSGSVTYCLFRPKITPIPPGFVDSCVDLRARQHEIYMNSSRSDYFSSGDLFSTLSVDVSRNKKDCDYVYSSSPLQSPSIAHHNYFARDHQTPTGNLPFYITSRYDSEVKHVDTPPEAVIVHSKRDANYKLQNVNLKTLNKSHVIQNNKSTHLETMLKSLNKVSDSAALNQFDDVEKSQRVANTHLFTTDIPASIDSAYAGNKLQQKHKHTVQRLDTPGQSVANLHITEEYEADRKRNTRQTSSPKPVTSLPPAIPIDGISHPSTPELLHMTPSADDGYEEDIPSDDTGESLTENSIDDSYMEKGNLQEDSSTRAHAPGSHYNMSGLSLI